MVSLQSTWYAVCSALSSCGLRRGQIGMVRQCRRLIYHYRPKSEYFGLLVPTWNTSMTPPKKSQIGNFPKKKFRAVLTAARRTCKTRPQHQPPPPPQAQPGQQPGQSPGQLLEPAAAAAAAAAAGARSGGSTARSGSTPRRNRRSAATGPAPSISIGPGGA